MMSERYSNCVRCGLCCRAGTCSAGEEGENGHCASLSMDGEGIAHCKLLEEGKVTPEQIGINGSGCALKKIGAYDQYKSWYDD